MRGLRLSLLFTVVLLSGGCFHTVHVSPEPEAATDDSIPASVKVEVTALAQEGPGSVPRIYYLKWTKEDLQQAIERYLQKRGTFAGEGREGASLTLSLKASLRMEHRDRYGFIFRVEGTLLKNGPASTMGTHRVTVSRKLKTYVGHGQAEAAWARWTTASDERPINEAVRLALNELFANIEADRELILKAVGS